MSAVPDAGSVSDIFLHVVSKRAGAIKGEGKADGHVDDIAVHSWTWGVSANAAVGSTLATARRTYRRLVVTKQVDTATTSLLSALACNDAIKEATLTMRKAGGQALDYFRVSLADARIVEVEFDVLSNGMPVERVSIAFTKVEVEHQRQQEGGSGGGSTTFDDQWDTPL